MVPRDSVPLYFQVQGRVFGFGFVFCFFLFCGKIGFPKAPSVLCVACTKIWRESKRAENAELIVLAAEKMKARAAMGEEGMPTVWQEGGRELEKKLLLSSHETVIYTHLHHQYTQVEGERIR